MKRISRKWQFVIIFTIFWALLGLCFAYISHSVINIQKVKMEPVLIFSLNLVKFFLWFACAPLILLLVKTFSFERRETFFRNFIIHIGIGFSFIVLHTLIYMPISAYFDPVVEKNLPTMATLFERYLFFGNFYLGVLLYTLIFIICQGYLFFESYVSERIRRSKLQTELADAKLQTLKMQLQPHFLFNTLHSISSLNLSEACFSRYSDAGDGRIFSAQKTRREKSTGDRMQRQFLTKGGVVYRKTETLFSWTNWENINSVFANVGSGTTTAFNVGVYQDDLQRQFLTRGNRVYRRTEPNWNIWEDITDVFKNVGIKKITVVNYDPIRATDVNFRRIKLTGTVRQFWRSNMPPG